MSRASRARRVAVTAAYGGGTVGVLGAAVTGVLKRQAAQARKVVGRLDGVPPTADDVYGDAPGEPVQMVMLGDSSAAGLGVDASWQTPGAILAAGLARSCGRPVRLRSYAAVGARSEHLAGQVDDALTGGHTDVVVMMIGANDVTHRTKPAIAVRYLDQQVRRLRTTGAGVVVGTCPDLGTIEPIARPLRWVARRLSRALAAAQTIAVVEAGGRSVSLGDLLGPEFARAPHEMFSADRFHPSATGYASAGAAILPALCAAFDEISAGTGSQGDDDGARSLARAAALASEHPGTEIHQASVRGQDRGPLGRWVTLLPGARRSS